MPAAPAPAAGRSTVASGDSRLGQRLRQLPAGHQVRASSTRTTTPTATRTRARPASPGWIIRAYVDTNGDGTLQAGETTDRRLRPPPAPTARYALHLDPGKYVVCEVAQANWFQREPVAANNALRRDRRRSGRTATRSTLTSGASDTGNDFGNYQQGTKSGIKFEDDNADGDKDAGEPGLAGWTIRAYVDDNGDGVLQAGETTVADSDATGADGSVQLQLDPGKYVVCEVQQAAGSSATRPTATCCAADLRPRDGGYAITVTSGRPRPATTSATTGRRTKSGIKYEDDNADGDQDAGEARPRGWMIRAYVDTNGDGVLQAGETTIADSDTTDRDRRLRAARSTRASTSSARSCQAGWFQREPVPANNRVRRRSPASGRTATRSTVTSGADRHRQRLRQLPAGHQVRHQVRGRQRRRRPGRRRDRASRLDHPRLRRHQRRRRPPGRRDHRSPTPTPPARPAPTAARSTRASTSSARSLPGELVPARPGRGNDRCAADRRPRRRRLRDRPSPRASDRDRQRLRQLPAGHQVRASSTRTTTPTATKDAGEARPRRLGHPRLRRHQRRRRRCRPARRRSPTPTPPPPTAPTRFTLDPGKYVVCEVLPGGLDPARARRATDAAPPIAGLGPTATRSTVTSGSTETGNDFGNYRHGTKSGIKYEDDNADGDQDAGEARPGRLDHPRLRRHQRRRHAAGRRDDDRRLRHHHRRRRRYALQLDPGKYVVCEVLPGGWSQSRAGRAATLRRRSPALGTDGYAIDRHLGRSSRPATTSATTSRAPSPGIKYEDDNADGDQDAGEPGLAGWVIRAYADTNGDGVLQAGETTIADSDTTDAARRVRASARPRQVRRLRGRCRPAGSRRARPGDNRCAAIRRLGADGYAIDLTSGVSRDRQRLRQLPRTAPSRASSTRTTTPTATRTPARTRSPGWVIRAYADTNGDGTLQAGETTIADSDTHHGDRRLRAPARPRQVRRLRGAPGGLDPARARRGGQPLRRDLGPRRRRLRDRRHLGLTETGNDFGNFRPAPSPGSSTRTTTPTATRTPARTRSPAG